MSKSVGNSVDPMALAERFGVDALRYFLLREVSFGQDGSYSAEAIVNRVNAELANSFGNLAQRTLSMVFKNLDGVIPPAGEAADDVALLDAVGEGCATLATEFDRFAFSAGIEAWMEAVFACNAYVDAQAPWALKKTDPERMAAVLGTLVAAVRLLAEAIAPVIPASAASLIALIDRGADGTPIAQPIPIFPRSSWTRTRRPEADRQPLPPHLRRPRRAAGRGAGVGPGARSRRFSQHLHPPAEWDDVIAMAEREPDVWASVGVHPHEADAHPDLGAAALVEASHHPKVVAIGECGLDYYYDKSDRAAQRERFAAHIEAARTTGLPLIIHTRDAEDDTAEILADAVGKGGVTGVLHCFTGSAELARTALDLGFFISISGIVTFKNAKDLQETAKIIPLDRLLVETDSPFLAPVPHRGKPCEPAFVADTAAFVAELRGEPLDDLAAATTANFFRLFNKAAP